MVLNRLISHTLANAVPGEDPLSDLQMAGFLPSAHKAKREKASKDSNPIMGTLTLRPRLNTIISQRLYLQSHLIVFMG